VPTRLAPLLLIIIAPLAHAQPAGLPGAPVLPSSATTSVAPATTSTTPFVGRWVLRGHTTPVSGEGLPTVVRLTVRARDDGGLSIERAWEVTLPDGTERRSEASTCDVTITAADRLEARLTLVHRPTVGLAGAIEGATAQEVTNAVEWRLVVGPGGARELTTNLTRLAPEHRWKDSNVTGHRLQVQDLVSAPVKTLVDHGPPAERYDITFVSDGYGVADLPVFRRHVREAVARLQATSPFREYWGYINVHRVEVASRGSGLVGGRGGPSALGTRIATGVPPDQRFPSVDGDLVKKVAARAPGADATVVMCFDPFRSVAEDGYTLVSTWQDRYPRTVVHELGHVIGLLLDEYDADDPGGGWDFLRANVFVEGIRRWSGWGANVTTHTSRDGVPWRHWLPAGVPIPTRADSGHAVGVFEGAYHAQRRWYRPSPTCLMRESDEPFCVVCREQLVLKLAEKTSPVRVRVERLDEDTARLSVSTIIPGPHRIVWRRGGGFAVSSASSVVVRREDVSWGDTTLWLEVQDLTPFVRKDERRLATVDYTFVLRKGLIWDRGLEVVGPIRGRPSGGDSYGGSSSGWDPNGFPR
jgi:hypothetical protein